MIDLTRRGGETAPPTRQAERAGVRDERPEGQDTTHPWLGSRQPSAIGGTPSPLPSFKPTWRELK